MMRINRAHLSTLCLMFAIGMGAIPLASWADTVPEGSRSEKLDRICQLNRWQSCSLVDDLEVLPNSADLGANSLIGHKDSELEFVDVRRGWTGQQQLRQWPPKPQLRGAALHNDLQPNLERYSELVP